MLRFAGGQLAAQIASERQALSKQHWFGSKGIVEVLRSYVVYSLP